jgi:hypothetical protein
LSGANASAGSDAGITSDGVVPVAPGGGIGTGTGGGVGVGDGLGLEGGGGVLPVADLLGAWQPPRAATIRAQRDRWMACIRPGPQQCACLTLEHL